MSNKWSRPTNPPPPLFVGKKERDLIKYCAPSGREHREALEKLHGLIVLEEGRGDAPRALEAGASQGA